MSLFSTELFIAWRYLRAPRSEGVISLTGAFALVGIMLGVATLIVVTSVMNGFREELFARILGFHAEASITAPQGRMKDYESVLDQARKVPGIVAAAPLIEGQALMSVRSYSSGVLLRGITREDFDYEPLTEIDAQTKEDFLDNKGLLIGKQIARRFALHAGSSVDLLSPSGIATAFGDLPKIESMRVLGTFATEIYEYDNSFLLMSLPAAQEFLGYGTAIDKIVLRLTHPDDADEVQRLLQPTLPRAMMVHTWQEEHASLHEALLVERNVMFLILTLIVLIASFNIVSGQVMLVHDKKQGIAVLRALGAQPRCVMRIFMMTGSAIGSLGTILGLGLGIAVARNVAEIERVLEKFFGVRLFPSDIYSLPSLPSRIDSEQVLLIVSMAFVVTFLACLYPALRASRMAALPVLRAS